MRRAPTQEAPDGDAQFAGVNQADQPHSLPAGILANARNNRCRHFRAEPRLGPVKLPWSNLVTVEASSKPIPFGTIYGAGTFRDSDDLQWGIVAADGKVFRMREGNGSSEITLPVGVTINHLVTFEQSYNGLIMFRGPDLPELIMRSFDEGFRSVAREPQVPGTEIENPEDGTEPIPPADRGDFINGRMFIPYRTSTEKDLIAISDYNNATRYAPVRSQARINQGSSDKLVRVVKFGNSEIAVCFKESSVYQLAGISGSLDEMQQDEVTKEFGLAAPRAVINVGKNDIQVADAIWFLVNRRGIMTIAPDPATGRLGVQSLPVSREVGDIMERINWEAVRAATFAVWDNKFYGALPIDDARVATPNVVPAGTTYDLTGTYIHFVVPNATYRWTKGENDRNISDIAEVMLTEDSADVVATDIAFFLKGQPGQPVTATLQRVYTQCNNVVVVYDFERGQWAGYDTGSAIQVKEWLKLRFSGEERLFFLGEDGFINCYEWLFDDQTAHEFIEPYALAAATFDADGKYILNLVRLRSYIFRIGAGTTRLRNGTQDIVAGLGRFIADGDTVELNGSPGTPVQTEVGLVDWILVNEDIDHDLMLRAYLQGSVNTKRGLWARFHFRSWWPALSSFEVTEGVGRSEDGDENKTVEEQTLRLVDETKSRTRYVRPATKRAYDTTNINDDHATAHREDYALLLEDNTVLPSGPIQAGVRYLVESADVASDCSITYDGVVYNNGQTFVGVANKPTFTITSGSPRVKPPDSYAFFDGRGIDPDVHQTWSHDERLHSVGMARQFRMRNTQGRSELMTVEVVSTEEEQRPGERT